ncbi:(2Fe-2S)-binding protein [Hymenobacter sp. HSC-4F20]|uniref:2Fe-2S iron-sulfur cluster-binding protein n=1 Tax=Hymenobacter sp. HSC-4F20 TaxID=2864135 RepID=UPI001C72C45F|nr:2Fe-2S iron-sulfur cluster-binding protein [Hymenobacter sp. HSC-4F20]MBX0292456.1 (2Fe-2S)-binding protein [Hymenobacter sp. HSC-4F20]
MPTLLVQNLPHGAIAVPAGTTLLAAIQAAGHDWLHACGARGRCTTCRLQIVSGLELLTPPTEPELRYRAAGRLLPTERLTCQTRMVSGQVVGRVPDATKLPHVTYAE